MRTVLDVTVCTHSRGGVGRWVRGLAKGLMELSPEHMSIDLPETHPLHQCDVPGAVSVPPPVWMKYPLVRRVCLRGGKLESSRARRIERTAGFPDVIHLSGVQPFGGGRRTVVTFFDHTPWTDPDSLTPSTLYYAGRLEELVRRGASVLAISPWSAEKAVEIFSISPERVGCADGAAEDIFTPGVPDAHVLEELGLTRNGYYLHVGSFVPRKNIPFLIDCFQKTDAAGRKLVLAGAEKWGDNRTTAGDNVMALEGISDEVLLSLYRGAEAVLVPSSEEGLGLPVLESLACGTPVICSNGGALPETVAGCGLILPVLDRDAWVDALRTGVTDALRAKTAMAARPTWRDVGEKALAFYRSQL